MIENGGQYPPEEIAAQTAFSAQQTELVERMVFLTHERTELQGMELGVRMHPERRLIVVSSSPSAYRGKQVERWYFGTTLNEGEDGKYEYGFIPRGYLRVGSYRVQLGSMDYDKRSSVDVNLFLESNTKEWMAAKRKSIKRIRYSWRDYASGHDFTFRYDGEPFQVTFFRRYKEGEEEEMPEARLALNIHRNATDGTNLLLRPVTLPLSQIQTLIGIGRVRIEEAGLVSESLRPNGVGVYDFAYSTSRLTITDKLQDQDSESFVFPLGLNVDWAQFRHVLIPDDIIKNPLVADPNLDSTWLNLQANLNRFLTANYPKNSY